MKDDGAKTIILVLIISALIIALVATKDNNKDDSRCIRRCNPCSKEDKP